MATTPAPRVTPLLALVALVALLAGACGDDSGGGEGSGASTSTTVSASATTTTVAAGAEPSNTAAATLRTDLTTTLEEQVYLTASVVAEGLAANGRLDGPRASAASDAAEDSSTDLSDLVGTAYGVVAGADFLEVWDAHRDALVDAGLHGGGASAVDTARQAVVDQLAALDEDIDAGELSSVLQASDQELLAALGELRSGSDTAAADLRAAADEMPPVALSLAGTFADQLGPDFEGDVEDPGAELRAELSGLFQESAYLTGLGLAQVGAAGGQGAAPQGTLAAVGDNTADLAETLQLEGAAASDFTDLWDGHVQLFVDYLGARLANDAAGAQTAEAELDTFRDQLGEVVAEGHAGLSVEAVAEELVPHVDSMLAYADALAADDDTSPTLLREAGLAMTDIGRALAAPLSLEAASAG